MTNGDLRPESREQAAQLAQHVPADAAARRRVLLKLLAVLTERGRRS